MTSGIDGGCACLSGACHGSAEPAAAAERLAAARAAAKRAMHSPSGACHVQPAAAQPASGSAQQTPRSQAARPSRQHPVGAMQPKAKTAWRVVRDLNRQPPPEAAAASEATAANSTAAADAPAQPAADSGAGDADSDAEVCSQGSRWESLTNGVWDQVFAHLTIPALRNFRLVGALGSRSRVSEAVRSLRCMENGHGRFCSSFARRLCMTSTRGRSTMGQCWVARCAGSGGRWPGSTWRHCAL